MLNVTGAVAAMVDWVDKSVDNTIHVIKDAQLLDVNDLIRAEKACGRANHVVWVPRWMAVCGYYVLRVLLGRRNLVYLVFKGLWAFRTRE